MGDKVGKPTQGLGARLQKDATHVAKIGTRASSPVSKGTDVTPVRNLRGGADSIPAAKPRPAHKPSVHPIQRR